MGSTMTESVIWNANTPVNYSTKSQMLNPNIRNEILRNNLLYKLRRQLHKLTYPLHWNVDSDDNLWQSDHISSWHNTLIIQMPPVNTIICKDCENTVHGYLKTLRYSSLNLYVPKLRNSWVKLTNLNLAFFLLPGFSTKNCHQKA